MRPIALTSLVDVPVVVSIANKDACVFRPGRPFEIPVLLANTGKTALGWTPQHPLNLSYRWVTEGGDVVEREGLRTSLPAGGLLPGTSVELDLGGVCPGEVGDHSLQVSLVLEGRHWACDLGPAGWMALQVHLAAIPAWSTELRDSRGGRALRGAMVASELARLLAKRSAAEAAKTSTSAIATGIVTRLAGAGPGRRNIFRQLGDWFLGARGVGALSPKLDEILTYANQQDEHFRAIEKELGLLRDQLNKNGTAEDAVVPDFMKILAEARAKAKTHRLAQSGAAKASFAGGRGATARSRAKRANRGSPPRSPAR